MTKAAELAKMGEVITNSQIGGRRNILLNGAMQVAQRGTSLTGIGDGAGSAEYMLDRFDFLNTSAGRVTATQTADGPTGFRNCLKLAVTTADTSISASEVTMLNQRLEGQNVQQLQYGSSSAQPVTFSFYVKGNAAATYTMEFRNEEDGRNNGQEFSVTTDWTRVVLTFTGDTAGSAVDDDNTHAFTWTIILHGGTTFSGGTFSSNTWHSTNNQRIGENQTSFFDSTDRTFFITGVQMELGSQATPFEHRSFGEELQLCQRYFEKSYSAGVAPASDTSGGLVTTDTMAGDTTTGYLAHQLRYRVAKRAAPTVVIYDQAEASGKLSSHVTGVAVNNGQTASTEHAGDKSISVLRASGDAANGFRYHYTADAEL